MEKTLGHIATFIVASLFAGNPALAQSGAPSSRLDCTNGPLAKTYGASPWLVFACSDGTSIVVVSTKENKSHPFYFMLYLKEGKRYVVGEGSGEKAVTASTYGELEKLSEAEIAALIRAANAMP